jgi:hypothetical protein
MTAWESVLWCRINLWTDHPVQQPSVSPVVLLISSGQPAKQGLSLRARTGRSAAVGGERLFEWGADRGGDGCH